MPTSVLRRYTPPTCTLEIAAAASALSRWTDRPVLKNLRFHLCFDDPKLPPEQQVTIKGDQAQLEALCDAVGAYVQQLLQQSPERMPLLLNGPASVPGQGNGAAGAMKLQAGNWPIEPGSEAATKAGIFLQPKGLLTHDLCLGCLENEEAGSVVQLSTLQLFDLANALDEYNQEALALPKVSRSTWFKSPAGIARVAAVMVLALGATGAIVKFIADVSTPTLTVSSAPQSTQRSAESDASRTIPEPPNLATPPAPLRLEPVPSIPPTGATKREPAALPSPTPSPVPQAASTPVPPTPILLPGAAAGAPSSTSVVTIPAQPSNPASAPTVAAVPEAATASQFETARNYSIAPLNQDAAATARFAPAPGVTGPGQSAAADGTQTATNSTMFDAIPQVAQVRAYFQQHWQPPEGLKQTLEYSLVLNADGSIQRIVPLGIASEVYVDRTNMPLMGEEFVAPVEDGGNPRIRLVLNPDGEVRTFLEAR